MRLTESQRRQLVQRACAARENAYAKYSGFQVGAALLAEDGSFFDGVNVENASFGLTICAERTALFSAVTAGSTRFLAIAVATPGGHGPCGACRQVLVEFGTDLMVLMVDSTDQCITSETTIGALLPGNFHFPESESRAR